MYLEKVFRSLHKLDTFQKAAGRIQDGEKEIFLSGLVGSSANLIAAALFSSPPGRKRLLLITAGVESASRAFGDLQTFLPSAEVGLFPFTEILPNEELNPTAEVESQRLITLNGLSGSAEPFLVVTPIQAIIPPTVSPSVLKRYVFGKIELLINTATTDHELNWGTRLIMGARSVIGGGNRNTNFILRKTAWGDGADNNSIIGDEWHVIDTDFNDVVGWGTDLPMDPPLPANLIGSTNWDSSYDSLAPYADTSRNILPATDYPTDVFTEKPW